MRDSEIARKVATVTGNWKDRIRKSSAWLALFTIVAAGVGIAVMMIIGSQSPAPQQTATPRTALASPPPSVPTVREFSIGVVVSAQNCPPDAPCAYTYTIEPKYLGLHPLPVTEFTVEYEVRGGIQPQPGKFTVKGDQAQIMKDVVVEGPPNARLQAVVMRVIG